MTSNTTSMSRLIAITLVIFFAFPFSASALDDSLETNTIYKINSSSSLFYLGNDLHRYIFPNSATFESWYDDFDNVVETEEDILNQTPIGGLVTVKPGGETWIKIQSDPKVYTISNGGILHWISSEAMAEELGGTDWATRIIDLPDTVFAGYTIGMPVDIFEPTLDFDDDLATTINEDKSLIEPEYIRIMSDPFSRELNVSDEQATIFVNGVVHFENTSTDQNPEVIISGNNGQWSSGIIEAEGDFISHYTETGFYHFTCRSAYDIDIPINSSCGTITVVENNIED